MIIEYFFCDFMMLYYLGVFGIVNCFLIVFILGVLLKNRDNFL